MKRFSQSLGNAHNLKQLNLIWNYLHNYEFVYKLVIDLFMMYQAMNNTILTTWHRWKRFVWLMSTWNFLEQFESIEKNTIFVYDVIICAMLYLNL